MTFIQLVVPIMLVSGIVGGLINSYMAEPEAERPLAWWQHVVVGVGAAFVVPVFLNMISSNLILEVNGDLSDSKGLSRLLVLAGFCLLAAVSSRAFIRSLTDRVLKEVSAAKEVAKEAKQQAAKAEAIAELTVEPDMQSTAELMAASGPDDQQAPPVLAQKEKEVLQAMVKSSFSMRSIAGISKDTGIPKDQVNVSISALLDKGLIAEGTNKEGQLRWYPTAKGRAAVLET